MIVDIGLNEFVGDVRDDIINGETGDDGSLFVKSQIGVISALAGTDIALSTKIVSTKTINFTYLLDTSTANGETLAEYELNNGAIAYNRVPKSDYNKTSNDEVTVIHTFTFQVVL